MAALADNVVAFGRQSVPADSLTPESVLAGVDAVSTEQLPQIWQDIAGGVQRIDHPESDLLQALAILFYTKATDKSPEIFQQGFDFQDFYVGAATETLDFFGHDYRPSAYPDWDAALAGAHAPEADKVVAFAKAVFADFGTWLPASFYHMLLCPAKRGSIFESRAMFFHPDMQDVKRAFDSSLHALNVTAMLMRVQHHASRQGFLLQHGCGCDHELSQIIPRMSTVDFDFESEHGRRKALVAFTWRLWNEYALFPLNVHSESLAL